jgi:mannosyltransferase
MWGFRRMHSQKDSPATGCYNRKMISSAHSAVSTQVDATRAQEASAGRNTVLILWGIVALGAVLRVIAPGHKSFWLDEIASVAIARMPGNSFWWWLWRDEGNMALYYVMLRPWLHLGMSEAIIRLLSVLPGIASVPVMYLLGTRLFGRKVGILAALFLALNACSVVFSLEARGYSWLLLGVITSTYLLVSLVENPGYARACGYALAAGGTLYFHYFGLLVVLAQAVSLVALPAKRRPWKCLIVAGAMIATLAVPVLWMIHIQPIRHLDWVPKPSLLELYHIGVFLAAETGKVVGPVLLLLELVLLAIFLRTLTTRRVKAQAETGAWNYWLVASALFTPMVFTLLASAVTPLFFHRFLIICLPAWLLAIAVAAGAIQGRRMRSLAITGVCVLSLVSTVVSYTRAREDWRGLVTYLIEHADARDRVVYYWGVGKFAAESYRDWLPGGTSNRPAAVEVNPSSNDWRGQIAGAGRVWLVRYPANLSDDTVRAVEAELLSRYTAGQARQFRAVTVVEYLAKR